MDSGVWDPKSVGLRIFGAKRFFTRCYHFNHFLTSAVPNNPETII